MTFFILFKKRGVYFANSVLIQVFRFIADFWTWVENHWTECFLNKWVVQVSDLQYKIIGFGKQTNRFEQQNRLSRWCPNLDAYRIPHICRSSLCMIYISILSIGLLIYSLVHLLTFLCSLFPELESPLLLDSFFGAGDGPLDVM